MTTAPTSLAAPRPGGFLDRCARFVAGGEFAVFVLVLFALYQAFVLAMAFVPAGSPWLGGFAEAFRVRCFNYDPEAGAMNWTVVALMTTEPFFLQLLVYFVWRRQLAELWGRRRGSLWPAAGAGLTAFVLVAACLVQFGTPVADASALEFPADRIRTRLPVPDFTLTDQDGRPVSPAALRGRPVLLTTIYSGCTTACPMMLTQVRRVLDDLTPSERADLAVVAISLNPGVDTRELREMTARTYSFGAPEFHFVGGSAAEVDPVLDGLQVVRTRMPDGSIEHSSIFFCIDREGRIAFRLSSGEKHHAWLMSALRTLISEPPR